MDETMHEIASVEITEIERLIQDFKEKFADGTSDANHFISITEIELGSFSYVVGD